MNYLNLCKLIAVFEMKILTIITFIGTYILKQIREIA